MADDGDEEKTKSFIALTDMDMWTILNGRGSDLTKYQNLSSELCPKVLFVGIGQRILFRGFEPNRIEFPK